jgi:hypothetical protein
MTNFAVIEDGIVLNAIVADSKAIAEEITGKTCIEYTTEPVEPGGTYEDGNFIKVKPYPSWVLDDDHTGHWKAPVDMPHPNENTAYHYWDESKLSWVEVTN